MGSRCNPNVGEQKIDIWAERKLVLKYAADRRYKSAETGSRNRVKKFESTDKVLQYVDKNVSH